MKISLLENPGALTSALAAWGQPSYRQKQIAAWLYKGVGFEGMKDIPQALRVQLDECFMPISCAVESVVSGSGDTQKYLFAFADGECVEGVWMRYLHGNTICLSTQCGCRMGCVFCASTMGGLTRDCTSGEMLSQVIAAAHHQRQADEPLRNFSNLVLMGSGEPLDNAANVIEFIRRVSDPASFGVSPRNISLSTCGVPEGIRTLTQSGLGVTLCWSLHAPDDALRKRIMPGAAARGSIVEVLSLVKEYIAESGRRAIIEYTMIQGVNDSLEHARRLAALLRGCMCHVNLIPLNPVPGRPYRPSSKSSMVAFSKCLQQLGISHTARRTLGEDVNAACGQLRRYTKEQAAGGDSPADCTKEQAVGDSPSPVD